MGEDVVELDLQEGPQRVAAESDATIIFFGGAAGGGKTRWLVHDLAKYFDVEGYGACIYRRTYGELTAIGGVCQEMEKIYPHLGGFCRDSKHEWRFPSGAKVCWGQMEHVATSLRQLQGTQFCAIGMDELPHFEEKQFWMAFSRLRTLAGVRTRLLATMNPEPDSWVRRLIDWWIGEDGYPIAAHSGVVRWFERKDGILNWYDSEREAIAAGAVAPTSFTFIPAKIWDNPALMNADPGYLAKLRALPPVEQARFLAGNWNVREASGDKFQQGWFPRLEPGPIARKLARQPLDQDFFRKIRVWDPAGTPFHGDTAKGIARPEVFRARTSGDPDWTRGLLVAQARDKRIAVLDMVSARDTPGAIESLICRTAELDGPNVTQVIWQDPGQAAIYQIEQMTKAVRKLRRKLIAVTARLSKEDYAGISSRTAFAGNILVIDRVPWADEFFRELESFPGGAHDDIVDALSLAMVYFMDKPKTSVVGYQRGTSAHTKIAAANDVRTTARFATL